jgi:16S rRNA processing protein RimM
MITIGTVAGTHGYNGVIKARPTGSFPERFQGLTEVFLQPRTGPAAAFTVQKVKLAGDLIYLTLQGIDSLEAAQRYRTAAVQVPEGEEYVLPEGYFYHYQLVGLKVYEQDRELGVLREVLETGANDVYVVRGADKDYLLPAIAQVIQSVDLAQGVMQVRMLPGLEDI